MSWEWATGPGWTYAIMVTVAVGLVACVVFVVDYHRRTGGGWRHNRFGRYLMTRKILLGCLFALVLINSTIGRDWPLRQPLTFVLMSAFALQTFWPYRLLLEAQHEAREKEEVHQ